MTKKHVFKIGDHISMLNEPITGIIEHINNPYIIFLDQDGFEHECLMPEIVPNLNLHNLIDKGLEEGIQSKKEANPISETKKISKKRNGSKILEVDLHIQELVESEKGMRNIDMLNLQLQTATKQMEYAMQNKIQRVVFIHGIGTGVLKKELHLLLKKYKVEIYEASYSKYGQGATEVYVYQN